ncbi:coat protein [Ageratum virus 2]|nr:coat protein [Ageratum virus 2]
MANNGRRNRRRPPTRPRPPPRPVVVMNPPPVRRRPRRRRQRKALGDWRPYHLYGLKGNDKGYLTFGPSGQTPSLGGGTLKACAEYKITALRVQWKSQASSNTAGSMAIELGLGATITAVASRALSFKLSNSGSHSFTTKELGATGRMLPTGDSASGEKGEDQFRLAYSGNGSADVAGDLLCFFKIQTAIPK